MARTIVFFSLLSLFACEPIPEAGFAVGTKEEAIVGGSNFTGLPAVGILYSGAFSCTATLITPTRVLTAGHCINSGAAQMEFITGPSDRQVQTSSRVRRAVRHPGYNNDTLANDIAYVDLVAPLRGVTPIPMIDGINSSWVGKELLHVGYGLSNGVNQTGSGTKRAVVMPITDIWGQQFRYGAPGRNTCSGDSGGPALFRNSAGRYFIVGVTSYGDEQCVSYGVDTRVDAYLSFIGVPGQSAGAPAAPAPAPTPTPPPAATPPPSSTPAPATPPTSAPVVERLRDQNVFLSAGQAQFYDSIPVRAGTPFRAVLAGSGDGDLYVRWGSRPTAEVFNCRPWSDHTSEVCEMTVPAGETRAFVSVNAYLDSTYWLDVTYQN